MSLIYDALPIFMVRNESFWMDAALRPWLRVFPHILVADTGSTDGTDKIIQSYNDEQVYFYEFGVQTPSGLTGIRQKTTDIAREKGYKYIFLVDGDEIYTEDTVRCVVEQGFPESGRYGFTSMMPVEQAEDGSFWELHDPFSRAALYPSDTLWKRDYPREMARGFAHTRKGYFWWKNLPGYRYHAIHVHRCRRSTDDESVYMRLEKKHLFRERERPDVGRTVEFDMQHWLWQTDKAYGD